LPFIKTIICEKCGETLVENGKIIKRPNIIASSLENDAELNKDKLFPCYLCDKCYENWGKYLMENLYRNYHGQIGSREYTKLWNKTFREWLEGSESIIFI